MRTHRNNLSNTLGSTLKHSRQSILNDRLKMLRRKLSKESRRLNSEVIEESPQTENFINKIVLSEPLVSSDNAWILKMKSLAEVLDNEFEDEEVQNLKIQHRNSNSVDENTEAHELDYQFANEVINLFSALKS